MSNQEAAPSMLGLLGFCAIVKNEAHNIKATLESVKPFINYYAIIDTGSSDSTKQIIKEVFADIPGELIDGEFIDYAQARNLALNLLGTKTVFSLTLSADEVLHNGSALVEFLTKHAEPTPEDLGAFAIEMRDQHTIWTFPRVLRTAANWRYQGEIHETPVSPNKQDSTGPKIPDVYAVHTESDSKRKFDRIRNFDIPMLTKIVNDESKTLVDRAPALFFLAQSLENVLPSIEDVAGSERLTYQLQAMSYYWRYSQIVEDANNACHDPMKAGYAAFHYFVIASQVGIYTPQEIILRLEPLCAVLPWLPEVHCLLASQAARIDARKGLFLAEQAAKLAAEMRTKPTHLPLNHSMEWQALRVAASCAKVLKNDKRAKDLAERAITAGAPKELMQSLIN